MKLGLLSWFPGEVPRETQKVFQQVFHCSGKLKAEGSRPGEIAEIGQIRLSDVTAVGSVIFAGVLT